MSVHHGTLLCLGLLLMISGAIMAFSYSSSPTKVPLMVLGIFLGMGGLSLVVAGVCMAKKNFQVGVPGHFLLHPPTGTRFSPQQALAIQRRLDRIRREISTDAVSTLPEPEPSLPSTPPSWTMEPPPSYDTVMKSQEHGEQINQEHGEQINQEHGEQINQEQSQQLNHEHDVQQHFEHTECTNQDNSQEL
ncbi:uncharacterized protein si:dkeyp-51f12.3 isoform X2 [Fundulus heteroclitus]|uniref:uncharacterized protein si:dkeyp-51f12.3 isoform X2 n=1 Tax=Fundulus heteroclitus TaxID=8078 RepID=UPI00165AA333|nr:uncharacterized protein si:dkeyp-51f12.3 isoform X2 [Fundulus heteroclitus]